MTADERDDGNLHKAKTIANNLAWKIGVKSGSPIEKDQFRHGDIMPTPAFSSQTEVSVAITVLVSRCVRWSSKMLFR